MSNQIGPLITNDHYFQLPTTIFCFVWVHNAIESFCWDSETNDKTTVANQHLEWSSFGYDWLNINPYNIKYKIIPAGYENLWLLESKMNKREQAFQASLLALRVVTKRWILDRKGYENLVQRVKLSYPA